MGKKYRFNDTITRISIKGYKSVKNKETIDLRPLTILTGKNSSGKSSFIQPILLLKQTIEENYDPGALLLSGPLTKFTNFEQLLHKSSNEEVDCFEVEFVIDNLHTCSLTYTKKNDEIIVKKAIYVTKYKKSDITEKITIEHEMNSSELKNQLPDRVKKIFKKMNKDHDENSISIEKDRCFIRVGFTYDIEENVKRVLAYPGARPELAIKNIIYLPGLRGNPERNYPVTKVNSNHNDRHLPGKFEKYVASILHSWQINKIENAETVEKFLNLLDLTNKISTKRINDTQIEISVNALSSAESINFVNIADVGLGVSQTLPVLVALVYATPGQIVYIEQPEIHLHPKGQYEFSKIIKSALNRGVRIVIETHSSLIIKGIQTEVANKKIKNKDVSLNWFTRNEMGETEVNSTMLDENGAFGEWPIDFTDVELEAEYNYIQAGDI
ncbi:AAA family ATPase [Bacillus altitudinis]|uniref:AAA family ATPase n=1 Tax=Bacillus altitudinis TaxID=293387 RepID=UPI003D1F7E19